MKPLVSILIPAYNSQQFVADAIRSASAQTWPRKEVIVVDDGSTDRTAEVARRLASKEVLVITKKHENAAATRNCAFNTCQGDYIQWLDADDLLALDKIERQLTGLGQGASKRTLLSSPWAEFYCRTHRARPVPSSLWQDLSPAEWLVRKLSHHEYMQTATWLTSRELAESAGPWDTRLVIDDDGEYFCRVLLASDGVRFVPGAMVYQRVAPPGRVSHLGRSNMKKDALATSIKLHIQYLRSLEDSDRVREACLTFLQNFSVNFYPERPDLVAELEALAVESGGRLKEPRLRPKYAWMRPLFGFGAAKRAQTVLPELKASILRTWDKAMYLTVGDDPAGIRARPKQGPTSERGAGNEAKPV